MKHTYSLALLAVACLTSAQEITAASPAKILKNLSAKEVKEFASQLENVEKAHEEAVKKLCSKFLSRIPEETPNLKAGISKLIALFAAGCSVGYYSGMNHETIEKKFNEEIRPALTLDNLPTKDETAAFVGQSTEYLKKEFKKAALKNPDQEPKTESNQENQNS